MAMIGKDRPSSIDGSIHSSVALRTRDCFTNAIMISVLLLSISVSQKREVPVLDIRITPYSFGVDNSNAFVEKTDFIRRVVHK